MKTEKNWGQKGFTLVETVSIIAIIGILATVALPKLVDLTGQAQTASVKESAKVAQAKLEAMKIQAETGQIVAAAGATAPNLTMTAPDGSTCVDKTVGGLAQCIAASVKRYYPASLATVASASNETQSFVLSCAASCGTYSGTQTPAANTCDPNFTYDAGTGECIPGASAVAALGNKYPSLKSLAGQTGTLTATPPGWNAPTQSTPYATPPATVAKTSVYVGQTAWTGHKCQDLTHAPTPSDFIQCMNETPPWSYNTNNNPRSPLIGGCYDALNCPVAWSLYLVDTYGWWNPNYAILGWDLQSSTCPPGYTSSGASCSLSNASQVGCPTGYSWNGQTCAVTNPADVLTDGEYKIAADNSGLCIPGTNVKLSTFGDSSCKAATTANYSGVACLIQSGAVDAANCP